MIKNLYDWKHWVEVVTATGTVLYHIFDKRLVSECQECGVIAYLLENEVYDE